MKHNVLTGILIFVFLLFSACGTGSDKEAVSLEPHSLEADNASDSKVSGTGGMELSSGASAADGNMQGTGNVGTGQGTLSSGTGTGTGQGTPASGTGEAGLSTANDPSDVYRAVYLQTVNEDADNAKRYSLIYLDADDIPELAVHDMGYDSYSIYTVRDGAIFCMADSMTTVEMTYFERSGVIASFSRWNGGGDEGGYGQYYYQVSREQTLTNEDQPLLSFSYNAVYNTEGVYTGEGMTDYYHMDQEIDETAYQELLNSMGIIEDKEKLCMENSSSKEEMIGILSR